MEPDEVNIFAPSVLRDLEQIHQAEETRFARQLRSDIRKTDGSDGIDFDLAFFHAVAVAHFDMGALPDADAAGDFSPADSLAKAFGEYHEESLYRSVFDQVGD
jgi:hypothetical protein